MEMIATWIIKCNHMHSFKIFVSFWSTFCGAKIQLKWKIIISGPSYFKRYSENEIEAERMQVAEGSFECSADSCDILPPRL